MGKFLVIMESATKCVTVAKYLNGYKGNSYTVKASVGHFRDLAKGLKSIDVSNNFKPTYEIKNPKIAKELKALAKSHDGVIIATDLDREGEAIGWHLTQLLKLDPAETPRMRFNKITKTAIREAIKNAGTLDMDLVNAYQARRVADRLIGFELSPLLWRNIQSKLSAGRCQSPAHALIYDREQEISNFEATSYFDTIGEFHSDDLDLTLEGSFNKRYEEHNVVKQLLKDCKNNDFSLTSLTKKLSRNNPPPPYTTSTMQQDASNKIGMAPKTCMSVAQKLYEAGKITYMRTDSIELSPEALSMCKAFIIDTYGEDYHQSRKFPNKKTNCQDAHEAIRPTHVDEVRLQGNFTNQQQRLYDLIRKRTLASQMAPSVKDIFTGTITMTSRDDKVVCKSEQLLFQGYLAVYDVKLSPKNEKIYNIIENSEELLPVDVDYIEITSQEKYTKSQGRYTEATLIKDLEKRGIGRPATWSNLVSIIQDRGYVVKDTRPGKEVLLHTIRIQSTENKIRTKREVTTVNNERNKLFITDVGNITTDFLRSNFENIMDYEFTKHIEDKLDLVANGDAIWYEVVREIYASYHSKVEELLTTKTGEKREKHKLRKVLGESDNGEVLTAYLGKYGPVIQIGDHEEHKKNRFVGIPKELSLQSITLEDAKKLVNAESATGVLGQYEGKDVELKKGRYGFYMVYDGKNISIPGVKTRDMEVFTIKDANDILKTTGTDGNIISQLTKTLAIRKGPYGNYIRFGKKNIKLPKDLVDDVIKLKTMTKAEVMEIVNNPPKRATGGRGRGRGRGKGRGKDAKKTTKKTSGRGKGK
jgi:DNA topoisomerase-1